MIRNYLLADSDPGASEARVERQRQALEDEVSKGLSRLPLEKLLGWRTRAINTIRTKTKYFIKLRENSRFFHIMGFYAVRLKVLKAETALMDSGALKCKDDIFYLSWQQVEDLQSGILKWADVEDLIRARRIKHIRLNKLRAPKTIGVEIKAKPEDENAGHQLKGQAASPGSYRGYARVIMDPATDAEIKPGEILIAPYTDPAWTPLFLIANAAVIEVGSYLSHAGTIAREYGMPCVVDVADCTNLIVSGDLIEVDGSSGTVHLIDEQPPEETVLNEEGKTVLNQDGKSVLNQDGKTALNQDAKTVPNQEGGST
jgi:pyruvate,water dikinase